MIRYGIIGCGNISKFHFDALNKLGARVTWVADINLTAAQERAAGMGARASADYRELAEAGDVDVVSIVCAGTVHKDAALRAIGAGKHVICEKTMMTNQADAYETVRAVQKSGTLFFVCYMKRFFMAVQKMKELMPVIGKVYSAQTRSYQAWGNFYSSCHGWDMQGTLKGYGGAVTNCAGSHMLDMIVYLLGRPDSVYANINYYPDTAFDRKATAIFEYNDDKTVQFETLAHPLKYIGYERNSWDEGIRILGTEGTLELSTVMWDHPENNGLLLRHYDNQSGTSTEYRYEPENPFVKELAYFNTCLEKGIQGNPGYIEGFQVDAMIEHMFLASQKKRSVHIDWMDV